MKSPRVDYSVVDQIDSFTIARAANLWAGYPPAYASHSLPLVVHEPADGQSAASVFAVDSPTEVLINHYPLDSDAYDIATAMKAAIKEGCLGKKQSDPRMETHRSRGEFEAFALEMNERAAWALPAFLFTAARTVPQTRREKGTTRSLKGLVAIIAGDMAPKKPTLTSVRAWLLDYSHNNFEDWDQELERYGIAGLRYDDDAEETIIEYEPEMGQTALLADPRKLRSLERYITAYNQKKPIRFK